MRPEIIDIDVTELLQILDIILHHPIDWTGHASKSFSNGEPWNSHDEWWQILGKGLDKLQVMYKWPQRLIT